MNFAPLYDRVIIIDCRFDYEFDGGHIRSAINVNATDDLAELLFQPDMLNFGDRICVILHCEFSSQRGPKMCVAAIFFCFVFFFFFFFC
jgi:rhodanese-related sulfurtransferase